MSAPPKLDQGARLSLLILGVAAVALALAASLLPAWNGLADRDVPISVAEAAFYTVGLVPAAVIAVAGLLAFAAGITGRASLVPLARRSAVLGIAGWGVWFVLVLASLSGQGYI
ncbi:MAG: hypothetical protein ACR2G3_12575 [Solirubrobacterales bacterium]